jgi:hypothetical protein
MTRARLAAQLPIAEKAARADHVIDNSGPLTDTWAAADTVLQRVCEALGVDAARYFAPQATPAGEGSSTLG